MSPSPSSPSPWGSISMEDPFKFLSDKTSSYLQKVELVVKPVSDKILIMTTTGYAHASAGLAQAEDLVSTNYSLVTSQLSSVEREQFTQATVLARSSLAAASLYPQAVAACATLGLVAAVPHVRSVVLRNTLGRLRSDEGRLRALERRARNITEDHVVRKNDEEKLITRLTNAQKEYSHAKIKLEAAAAQLRALEQRATAAHESAGTLAAELRIAPSREAALLRADVGKVATDIKRQKSVVTRKLQNLTSQGLYV